MNDSKGKLILPLERSTEKVKICINGSYVPKMTDKISYKYYIDGKPVEGILR